MLQFSLFKIPIQVQPFFLLIMAYIGGGFNLIQAFTTNGLIHMLVFMAAGFVSILVHELGHALMMQRYGRHPQIILHGMGGVAMSSGSAFSKKENLLVTIMGPAAQIVLGLIALGIWKGIGSDNFPTSQSLHFISSLTWVSLFWALANLIPVHPLDGGQILGSLLGNHRRKALHLTSCVIAGLIIAFLLVTGIGFQMPIGLIILGFLLFENIKALKNQP